MLITKNVVILLLAFVACMVLQIFLSRLKSRVWGWILPACTFLYALAATLLLVRLPDQSTKEFVGTIVVTFLISCTPTLLLIGVRASVHEGMRRRRDAQNTPPDGA